MCHLTPGQEPSRFRSSARKIFRRSTRARTHVFPLLLLQDHESHTRRRSARGDVRPDREADGEYPCPGHRDPGSSYHQGSLEVEATAHQLPQRDPGHPAGVFAFREPTSLLRGRSSTGQSTWLRTRRLRVQVLPSSPSLTSQRRENTGGGPNLPHCVPVAQMDRVPVCGTGCRRFKSCRGRHFHMVGGDRLVDRQVVDLDVAGSNPVAHPILVPRSKWTRHRPVTPEEASSSLVGIAIFRRVAKLVRHRAHTLAPAGSSPAPATILMRVAS